MPKKKSIRLSAQRFAQEVDGILEYVEKTSGLREEFHSWCADYAVIRLYREFETLMLDALAGAINNDTQTISATASVDFPKHMNEDVCRYLIVGTGYFDFRGRDGLIKIAREFVPESHYLVQVIKDPKFKEALERLSAFRNLAAHDSDRAKDLAKAAIGGEKIGSAGSWVRKQGRLKALCETLKSLSHEIQRKAPY
jgi:hypothetical protein